MLSLKSSVFLNAEPFNHFLSLHNFQPPSSQQVFEVEFFLKTRILLASAYVLLVEWTFQAQLNVLLAQHIAKLILFFF